MKEVRQKIIDAFNFRFACKEFDESRKIPKEDFDFILETARLSPSSFGFEPWKFLIVQNHEIREKLKEFSWGAQKQLKTSSHFVIILARKAVDTKAGSDYVVNVMKEIQKLPDDIIKMKSQFFKDFQEKDFDLTDDRKLFDWASKQTYIPFTNMMTSAAQVGIDSCPIEGFSRENIEKILVEEGILNNKHFGVAAMVAFGYRKENPTKPKTRGDINKVTKWVE
jgi:nitroreductase